MPTGIFENWKISFYGYPASFVGMPATKTRLPQSPGRTIGIAIPSWEATRPVRHEPQPEQLAANMRNRAGHYEILGETYARVKTRRVALEKRIENVQKLN